MKPEHVDLINEGFGCFAFVVIAMMIPTSLIALGLLIWTFAR